MASDPDLQNKKNETISTKMNTISSEEMNNPILKTNKHKTLKKRKKKTVTFNVNEEHKDHKSTEKLKEEKEKEGIKEEEKEKEKEEVKDEEGKEKQHDEAKMGLTPLPTLSQKKGENVDALSKDVQNAIMLRRQEYNDYIKSLNKPKPKKPKPKPKPKPKVYNAKKVVYIQKMYKGFQTREVNQQINRLKVNLCVTELFCLLFKENFIHARKRLTFMLLRLYYHEPFVNICNEVDFFDRLTIKLSDRYYTFKEFKLYRRFLSHP